MKDTPRDGTQIEKKTNHDIRASLAIAAGFSQGLTKSFNELTVLYGPLEERASKIENTVFDNSKAKSMEAECHFLISRLCASIDQLKVHFNELDR